MSDVHKVAPTRPFRRGRRARGAKIHPNRLAVDAFISFVRIHILDGRIIQSHVAVSRRFLRAIARSFPLCGRRPPVFSADDRDDAAPLPHPFLAGLAFEVAEQRPSTLHKRQEPSTPPSSTRALQELEELKGEAIIHYLCPICSFTSTKADGSRCPVCSNPTERLGKVS